GSASTQRDASDNRHLPVSRVEGHHVKLVYVTLAGKEIIAVKGRVHDYEGYDLDKVTLPVRIFKEVGVESVIITNAAGGVNEAFNPGDLMIITDHLNFTGSNPLIGQNISEHGPRFVDMTETYSQRGQQLLKDIAKRSEEHT